MSAAGSSAAARCGGGEPQPILPRPPSPSSSSSSEGRGAAPSDGRAPQQPPQGAALAIQRAALAVDGLTPPSPLTAARANPDLPLTTRLRIEAARRLAEDPELDAIEEELRRDLHAKRKQEQQATASDRTGRTRHDEAPAAAAAEEDSDFVTAQSEDSSFDMIGEACELARLPQPRIDGIAQWCAKNGVKELVDLLEKRHFAEMVAASGLKPLEAERLSRQLRIRCLGHKRRTSLFWVAQTKGRPLRVIFVRHGESEANVNRALTQVVPDHQLHLTQRGREQALDAGLRAKTLIGNGTVKFLVSPYTRTRETLNGLLSSFQGHEARLEVRSDVRIREQEYGNFDRTDMHLLHEEKSSFGAFYYRFPDGESPADCHDRASIFLESLYRMWEDDKYESYVIVSHGLMILVMLMRLLRYPVEVYGELASLENCEFLVLERPVHDPMLQVAYSWREGHEKDYTGLRRKPRKSQPTPIWSGDPEAEALTSVPSPERVEHLRERAESMLTTDALTSVPSPGRVEHLRDVRLYSS